MGWSFQYPLDQARYCKKASGFLISMRNVLAILGAPFFICTAHCHSRALILNRKTQQTFAWFSNKSARFCALIFAISYVGSAVRIWNAPREYQTHSMKVLAGGRCVNNISQFAAVATFPIPAGVQNLVRTTPYFIPRHRGLKQLRRITHPNANSPTRMQISVDRNITKLPVWHIRERIISFALRCS